MTSRRTVGSGAPWEERVGYSRAVRVGDHVWVSGTTATGADGAVVGGDDMYAQTTQALRNVETALASLGLGFADVVRTRMFVTDISRWEEAGRAHGEVFGDVRPAATMVEVRALIDPAMLVEVEVEAMVADEKSDGLATKEM